MEKQLLTEAMTVIMAETMYTAEKVEEAVVQTEEANEKAIDLDNKVIEAGLELSGALNDSFQQFKKESEVTISVFEKTMIELLSKIESGKQENKVKFNKRIAHLEHKKNDLRMMLLEYKEDGEDKWTSFKADFKCNLDDLEEALKHFMVCDF